MLTRIASNFVRRVLVATATFPREMGKQPGIEDTDPTEWVGPIEAWKMAWHCASDVGFHAKTTERMLALAECGATESIGEAICRPFLMRARAKRILRIVGVSTEVGLSIVIAARERRLALFLQYHEQSRSDGLIKYILTERRLVSEGRECLKIVRLRRAVRA